MRNSTFYNSLFLLFALIGSSYSLGQPKKVATNNNLNFIDMNKNGRLDPYEDTSLPINKRIDDLVDQLSVDEKVNLVLGTGMFGVEGTNFNTINPVIGSTNFMVSGAAGTTTPLSKYGIPAIVMTDGPAGVRIKPKRERDIRSYYATAFPIASLLASTWDINLMEKVGSAISEEAKEYGSDVQLAPAINIIRNPLGGRNFEYYTEDPFLNGKMAAAMINGIQKNGIAASLKHYAGNNNETNRMQINIQASQRALREIYLRGFEIAVKEAQPKTIMSSYNKLNGSYTSTNYDLLTTILRKEWGFKGLVMTDWFGGFPVFKEIVDGKITANNAHQQISAGNDLLMPGLKIQKEDLLASIKSGKLSMESLNTSVKRVLELVFNSPKMNKYEYSDKPDLEAHAKIAREAAGEGMILLKNNDNTLPLSKKNIAVFGASSYQLFSIGTGSGYVYSSYVSSLIKALENDHISVDQNLAKKYSLFITEKVIPFKKKNSNDPFFPPPPTIPELNIKSSDIDKSAKSQDIAIITIGRNSGELADRGLKNDFELTSDELKLINKVSNAFHDEGKKVIVILNISGAIETQSWKDKVDAILISWLPGQEAGNAISDVLTGNVNPSGKLAVSFPIEYKDVYSSNNFPEKSTVKPDHLPQNLAYKEGIYVGYRYFKTFNVKPSYEFGYGLSYTQFEYSNLKLNNNRFNEELHATIDIKNTGKYAGKEIVQLYLSAPAKEIDKPVIELKAFAKTKLLQPGETESITFKLDPRSLASFAPNKSAWVAEAGAYKVLIGSSSENIKQTESFSLDQELVVEKVNNVLNNDGDFIDLKPQ